MCGVVVVDSYSLLSQAPPVEVCWAVTTFNVLIFLIQELEQSSFYYNEIFPTTHKTFPSTIFFSTKFTRYLKQTVSFRYLSTSQNKDYRLMQTFMKKHKNCAAFSKWMTSNDKVYSMKKYLMENWRNKLKCTEISN